jgi:Tfp pilus assembly protein PilO
MSAKILFLPVCIIAALAIFIWITKPTYDDLKKEKKELEKKEATLMTLEEKKASLQKAVIEYDSLGSDAVLVLDLLPKNVKADDFVAEISSKAKDSGIALSKIKTSLETSNALAINEVAAMGIDDSGVEGVVNTVLVKGIEVEASSFGSYDGFKKFVGLIEGMKRYVDLTKVQIKKVDSEEGAAGHDIVEANISLKIYTLEDDSQVQIASKIFANDPIITGLSSGTFDKQALDQSKVYVTSTFQFVPNMDGLGKENIFFW